MRIKQQSENCKLYSNKKLDNSMIKGIKWGYRKTNKLGRCRILLRTREGKVWWIKRKLENFRTFFKGRWNKLTSLITESMISQGKVKKMTRKSDIWDRKFRRKGGKAPLTKILSESWSIFWLRKWDCSSKKTWGTLTFRMILTA